MAVKGFATNYLVKAHDMHEEYMKFKNELSEKTDKNLYERLFIRYGGKGHGKLYKEAISINKDFVGLFTSGADGVRKYRFICMWHCISISAAVWEEVCKNIEPHHGDLSYKKFYTVPIDSIKKFKQVVEKTIKSQGCDYNKAAGHGKYLFDACRYLAMYWTYLDIVKDEKTMRYFPTLATISIAAKVFGYSSNENPFELNGRYYDYSSDAYYEGREDQPVEEEKKYNLNLDTPIEDLDFSTRSYNCLWRAGHRTLGDVLKLKYEDLMKIRNLGLHHTKEILEKLEEIKKQSEESVIDIAEEAAKKVEEEEKLVAHDHSYVIPDEDVKVLAGLGKRLEKIDLGMDDIRANAAAKSACVMLDKRIDELRDNSSKKFSVIDGDIRNLDNEMTEHFRELHELIQRELSKRRPSEPPIIAHKSSDDILSLCNQIVAIMQKSGMEEFCMKGDWVIDIHRKAEMGRATITYR